MTAPTGPGPRLGHGFAHDAHSGITMLFGGFDENGAPLGDTWGWDGTSWRLLATDGPPARKWPAMAYDEVRDEVILFGGLSGIGRTRPPFGDTWRWTGSAWCEAKAAGPGPRDHVRTAWDRRTDRLILFGGFDGGAATGDTWAWDGERWEQVAADGPPPRAAHGMVCDPNDGSILLFGGRSLERFFGDTWRWNGNTWTRVSDEGPSPRAFHGMAPSVSDQAVLLFGGWEGTPAQRAYFNDTWAWSGVCWERVECESPPAGGVYAMTHDATGRGVLFHGGGRKAEGTTWCLEDRTWLHRDGRWAVLDSAV